MRTRALARDWSLDILGNSWSIAIASMPSTSSFVRGYVVEAKRESEFPSSAEDLLCPTSFAGHGGIEDNWRESRSPLLGQGGVAAPIKKMPRSLLSRRRRGGWFKPPIIGS